MKSFRQWLGRRICGWLLQEAPASASPRCDFDRLRFELRPGDVILVEGRSRIGDVIKLVTQSPWTHFRDQITALEEQQAEAATAPGIDADDARSPRDAPAPRRKELGV